MQFVSGAASPVPVYLPPGGLNDTPYGSLMGRPVIPMLGGSSQLGDEGDIMFVDFFYYHAALKSGTEGVRRAVSTHVYFDRDKTAFKFTFRMDGKCPYKSPVITEFGNHSMSGFVTLEDR